MGEPEFVLDEHIHTIDCKNVNNVDSAAEALLLHVKQNSLISRQVINITNISARFMKLIELYELKKMLELE